MRKNEQFCKDFFDLFTRLATSISLCLYVTKLIASISICLYVVKPVASISLRLFVSRYVVGFASAAMYLQFHIKFRA